MLQRNKIIGVMGPGNDCPEQIAAAAHQLGRLIAEHGWYLLTGGRDAGVMHAACQGAKEAGGLTIGILPDRNSSVSEFVDIAIFTDLGSGRNNINVLSSDVVVSCGMGAGTSSELSLALKADKPVIMLCSSKKAVEFYKELKPLLVQTADSAQQAVSLILNAGA